MAAKITKIGPVIVVEDDSEECIATFQICHNQARSSCAITTWEIGRLPNRGIQWT